MTGIYSIVEADLDVGHLVATPDLEANITNIKEQNALKLTKSSNGFKVQGKLSGINALNEALRHTNIDDSNPFKRIYIQSKIEDHAAHIENVERFMVDTDASLGGLKDKVSHSANISLDPSRFCFTLLDKTEQITEYLGTNKAQIRVRGIQSDEVRVKVEQNGSVPIKEQLTELCSDCTLSMSTFKLSVPHIANPKIVIQNLMSKAGPDFILVHQTHTDAFDVHCLCLDSRIQSVEAQAKEVLREICTEKRTIETILLKLCDEPEYVIRTTDDSSKNTIPVEQPVTANFISEDEMEHDKVGRIHGGDSNVMKVRQPDVLPEKHEDNLLRNPQGNVVLEAKEGSIGNENAVDPLTEPPGGVILEVKERSIGDEHVVDSLAEPKGEVVLEVKERSIGDEKVMDYLLMFHQKEIKGIESTHGVEITTKRDKLLFLLTGQDVDALKKADFELNDVAQGVFQMRVDDVNISRVSEKRLGDNFSDILMDAEEAKISIERKGNSLNIFGPAEKLDDFVDGVRRVLGLSARERKPLAAPETRDKYEPPPASPENAVLESSPPATLEKVTAKAYLTKNDVWIYIWKTDITKIHTDVIVNAANEDLNHGGGVAYAISKAGGPEIDEASAMLIKNYGKLDIAGIHITTAGRMPSKKVMHTVGPQWDKYRDKEKCGQDLYKTFLECLKRTNVNNYNSIAFPAISSGIYGVPLDLVAEKAAEAVSCYSSQNSFPKLKHVHFVDIVPDTLQAIQTELDKFPNIFQRQNRYDAFHKWLQPNARHEVDSISNTNPAISMGHQHFEDGKNKNDNSEEDVVVVRPPKDPRSDHEPLGRAYSDAKEEVKTGHIPDEDRNTIDTPKGLETDVLAKLGNGPTASYDPSNFNNNDPTKLFVKHKSVATDGTPSNPLDGTSHKTPPDMKEEQDKCSICLDIPKNPEILDKCKHVFCKACIKECFEKTQPKCPNCGVLYGEIRGNQPEGFMVMEKDRTSLPGYEGCGTIIIEYSFPNGIQTEKHPHPGRKYVGTRREAFLPDNEEGIKVHRLLQRAFEANMVFTIGTSSTTGRSDSVIWNCIHHKTSRYGGPLSHGYPDPTYLTRVKEELASQGFK